jgi:hypothetical protein
MDEADAADDQIEAQRAAGIEQARRAPALRPKQACHFCDELVTGNLLFCDIACREDFDAEEAQLKRMGMGSSR